MAAFGDYQYTFNVIDNYNTSASANTMQVYPAFVATPVEPEPEPELTPLDWLRGQVSEVCELAFAA